MIGFFDAEALRSITGGRWRRRPTGAAPLTGVGIDTRVELSGRAYVAIRGDRHDGHAYLEQASAAGAALAIVEREPVPSDGPPGLGVLLVPDTRAALGRIAHAYRARLTHARVVAVTGSSGKTTTKRLIDAVLAATGPGTSAPRSFNNEIGVPLTLLAARPTDRYVVVEIGANAPGEIGRLARLAEPDVAVITNVGSAHLAGFGSPEAIAREKSALLGHVRDHGAAVVNADSPRLAPYGKIAPTTITFGGSAEADLRLTARGAQPRGGGWWFEVNGRTRFDLGLPGRHNAINALAAVAIGRRAAVSDERMSAALAAVAPEAMRMTEERAGGVRLYNDAYNANPESMDAALATFAEVAADAPRRVVVLGDMLELGDAASREHERLGHRLIETDRLAPIAYALLVGEHVRVTAGVLRAAWGGDGRVTVAASVDEAVRHLRGRLGPGDAVLLKASRGVGLERVADAVRSTLDSDGAGAVVTMRRTPGHAAAKSDPVKRR